MRLLSPYPTVYKICSHEDGNVFILMDRLKMKGTHL